MEYGSCIFHVWGRIHASPSALSHAQFFSSLYPKTAWPQASDRPLSSDPPSEALQIWDLNDDCLNIILGKLSIEDRVSVSAVRKELRRQFAFFGYSFTSAQLETSFKLGSPSNPFTLLVRSARACAAPPSPRPRPAPGAPSRSLSDSGTRPPSRTPFRGSTPPPSSQTSLSRGRTTMGGRGLFPCWTSSQGPPDPGGSRPLFWTSRAIHPRPASLPRPSARPSSIASRRSKCRALRGCATSLCSATTWASSGPFSRRPGAR